MGKKAPAWIQAREQYVNMAIFENLDTSMMGIRILSSLREDKEEEDDEEAGAGEGDRVTGRSRRRSRV